MQTNDHIRAIVIGNGESRKGFDLDRLKDETTFGCNALYRDWWPSYLIALDERMVQEILHSDYPEETFVEPPESEKWEPAEVNPNRPRSNAGVIAINEALAHGFTQIYCMGFDFLIRDKDKSTSNLYDGTPCYGMETRAVYGDNMNRARFLLHVILHNPKAQFNFVLPEDDKDNIIIAKDKVENFDTMSYEEFEQCLN